MENFGKDWSSKITKTQADKKSNGKAEPKRTAPSKDIEDREEVKRPAKPAKRAPKPKLDSPSGHSDSLEDFVASSECSERDASSVDETAPPKKKQIGKRAPQRTTPEDKSQSLSSKLKKTGKPIPKRRPKVEDSELDISESDCASEESDRPRKRQTKKPAQPASLDDSDLELIEKNVTQPRANRKEVKAPASSDKKPKPRKAAVSVEEDSDSFSKQPKRGRRRIIDSHDEDESY